LDVIMTNRRILPQRWHSEIPELRHKTETTDQEYTVSVGYFPTLGDDPRAGGPAEVFVSGTKVGSGIEAVARDGAVLLSLALQYGVPLAIICGAITRDQAGKPSSIMGAIVDLLDGHSKVAGEIVPSQAPTREQRLRDDIKAIVEQEMGIV
jgi:hypothetical protein